MKRMFAGMVCLAGALGCAALAESTPGSAWVGVWESKLDGQPGATLTLAQDTGELTGTLVLNIIKKEKGGVPHIVASEPHVLVNPQLDGDRLNFSVKKIAGSSDLLNFTVALTPEGKARIHCTNCGKDAPTVDMERAWQPRTGGIS